MTTLEGTAAARLSWHLRRRRRFNLVRSPLVALRHRDLAATDVLLAEYPRSGGTWLTFVLAEIVFGQAVDFDTADELTPLVGKHRRAPSPPGLRGRMLRTHERYRPEYERCVYIVRHVADVAVSYYHFLPWIGIAQPDFKVFLRSMLAGEIDGYSPWPQHVESWLDAPRGTVHVLTYEKLRKQTETCVTEALTFLGIDASAERVQESIGGNTVDRMREKERRGRRGRFAAPPTGQPFVRQGAVGRSRDVLDSDDIELIERVAGDTLQRVGYELLPEEPDHGD